MSPLQSTAESHPLWQFWERNESTEETSPPEIPSMNIIKESNSYEAQDNNTKKTTPLPQEIEEWLLQEVPKAPFYRRWSIMAELLHEKFGQSYSAVQLRRYHERLRENKPHQRQTQKAKVLLPRAPALKEEEVKEILHIISLKKKINTVEIGQALELPPSDIYSNIISGDLGNNSEYRKSIILKHAQLFPNPQEVVQKIDTLFKNYIQATANRLRRDKPEALSALPDSLIEKAHPRQTLPTSLREFALGKAEEFKARGERVRWKEVVQDVEEQFQITIDPEKLRKSCNSLQNRREARTLTTTIQNNISTPSPDETESSYTGQEYGLLNSESMNT